MAKWLTPDVAAYEQALRDRRNDEDGDYALFMWIADHIDFVGPFAELEARLDKALQCTTFTGQMAAMEDSLNIDATKLPDYLQIKWEQLIVRIAETTVFGECAPPGR